MEQWKLYTYLKLLFFIAVVLNLDEIRTESAVKRNGINVPSTKFKMPAVIDKKTYISVNRFESLAEDDESNNSDSIITDRQDNASNCEYINEFIFSIKTYENYPLTMYQLKIKFNHGYHYYF
jgi:hypothetical protein